MDLPFDFKELLEELARDGVELVLVGGYEVVFTGQPPLRVDFLREIDGVDAAALFAAATTTEIDGVRLKVISLDHLITNKRAAGRPQDIIDADFLERVRAHSSE